jgi:hypothetical protein
MYQFARGRRDSDAWRKRDLLAARRLKLVEALTWFESATNQRSAAIAVVEGHWDEHTELRATWAAVLAASCVHIITKPDPNLSAADERDLNRMLGVLDRHVRVSTKTSVEVPPEIVAPIMNAAHELGTRIVTSSSGEQLAPGRRQAFVLGVMQLLQQRPSLAAYAEGLVTKGTKD